MFIIYNNKENFKSSLIRFYYNSNFHLNIIKQHKNIVDNHLPYILYNHLNTIKLSVN